MKILNWTESTWGFEWSEAWKCHNQTVYKYNDAILYLLQLRFTKTLLVFTVSHFIRFTTIQKVT